MCEVHENLPSLSDFVARVRHHAPWWKFCDVMSFLRSIGADLENYPDPEFDWCEQAAIEIAGELNDVD